MTDKDLDLLYSDRNREVKHDNLEIKNKYSKYRDLIYYRSSINPDIALAMIVNKPDKPSYLVATTHGWHMSIPQFVENNDKPSKYLEVIVDMRGRAFSEGKQDCNGYELFDLYDACEYVKKHYKDYIIDENIIFYEGGSGGGGNAYELACKFPDYFAAIVAMCGISDYALWYKNDLVGEFKDEMEPWIGYTPEQNLEAYASRSGIDGVSNLRSPMFIAHGETDIRVPCYHARNYVNKANEVGRGNLVTYWEVPQTGGPDHWTYITDENAKKLEQLCDEHKQAHLKPVTLERKGSLIIHGYLKTKYFFVVLDDIGAVGKIDYDIDKDYFKVDSKVGYKLYK